MQSAYTWQAAPERKGELTVSISHKIISLVLTIALVINPFEGLMANQATDADTSLAGQMDVVVTLDQFSRVDEVGDIEVSFPDCCCYGGHIGICGGIDCQYCCGATLVQAVHLALFVANHTRFPVSNTQAESFELPPAVPPPLTSVH